MTKSKRIRVKISEIAFEIDICDPVIDNIKLSYEYNFKLKSIKSI